jgi:hypothetical protein
MKNTKKHLAEAVVLVITIIAFYLFFHNWDHVKDFIVNLF